MRTLLKSNLGFTLVEVLIVGGIMGGLALVMSQMTTNQIKAAKSGVALMDRNSLQNETTAMFSNPVNCGTMLQVGAVYDFSSGNPPVLKIADPVRAGVVLLSSNTGTAGNTIFIQQMHLESLSAPVVMGANEKRDANLVIPMQKMRTGTGVNVTNNTGGTANIGSDNLVSITIRLSLIEESATHKLISCAASGAGAGGAAGCTAFGSTQVMTANGPVCQVVACQPGTFNAGVYGKTDALGHTKGDAVCCANGTHVAAIIGTSTGEDTPVCCGKQEYADTSGNCVPAGTVSASSPLCMVGYTELSVAGRLDDGSTICCHTLEIGSATIYVNLTCPGVDWMLNGAVGCGNGGDTFAYARLNTSVPGGGRGAPGVWGSGAASGINGRCKSNNDTRGMITCCRNSPTGVRLVP